MLIRVYFINAYQLHKWSFSLMDRISDSDSEGTGSIPVGTTKIKNLAGIKFARFFYCVNRFIYTSVKFLVC
jgi:hypothetical protein